MKKLALILCLALAACGPYVPPDSVCTASHTESEIVPMPTITTDYNGNPTTTITITTQYYDVCDQVHVLTQAEKDQLIAEHNK